MKWKYWLVALLAILGGLILTFFGSLKVTLIVLGIAIVFSLGETTNYTFLAGYRDNINLSEKTVLAIIIAIMFVGAAIPLLMHTTTSVFVSPYHLSIHLTNSSAIVSETLVYHVPSGVEGHEFYRSYYKTGPMKYTHVTSIVCPEGFTQKIYNYSDRFELACRFNSGYVPPGKYKVTFNYVIPKPYVCYTDLCLFDWNVMTDFKLSIINGTVSIVGAKDVWGFPPIGKPFNLSPDNLLEVKAVKPRSEVTSYWMSKNSPDSAVYSDKNMFEIYGFIYNHALEIELLIFAIAAGGLIVLYWIYGREPKVEGVPEVLHYPPTKRKPWDVTRIAYGDPNVIEFEGVQATLLDLARRGWLEIKDGVIKFKTGNDQLDDYEKKVYDTYKWLGSFTGGDLDMKMLRSKIKHSRNPVDSVWVRDVVSRLSKLTTHKGEKVFKKTGRILAAIWIGVVILISWQFTPYMPAYIKQSIIAGLATEMLAVLLLDVYTFGRFKKDVYKEVLLWRAFGRLLDDYSLIKKYAPQDINMWGDWLVYATALGKADNVIKALKEYNVSLPHVDYNSYSYIHPSYVYAAAVASASRAGSSSGSGGGGFGGGFGGGGGGFR